MLHWAITFLLLAIVSAFFLFAGTDGIIASLLAQVAAVTCLVLAVTMFAVHVRHRSPHS
jgi:uncharacterized membrane protein YtjA (UPF0391 family)